MNKNLLDDNRTDAQRSDALYIATHLAGAVALAVIANKCFNRGIAKAFLG